VLNPALWALAADAPARIERAGYRAAKLWMVKR